MMGMNRLIQFGTGRYGAVTLLLFLGVQGYLLVKPDRPRLDPARARAADELALHAASELSRYAQGGWSSKYVGVARIAGDHGDEIRHRIEKELVARTNCRMVTAPLLSEFRDSTISKVSRLGVVNASTADDWRSRPIDTLSDALSFAEAEDLDFVVFGTVDEFRADDDLVHLRATLKLADVAARSTIMEYRYPEDEVVGSRGDDELGGRPEPTNFYQRLFAWGGFILAFPVITSPFWAGLIARESNFVNALCLLALTIAGTIAAVFCLILFAGGLLSDLYSLLGWAAGSAVASYLFLNRLATQVLEPESAEVYR